MGSVFSCFIVSRHSRGWWERHRRTFLRFLPPTASTKWSGAFRETWGLFFCFTLSSRLFPALLILLVRLYLRHNDLIATTCLPNSKKKLHSGGLTSSFFFVFFCGKLLFKCNIAFENDSHLWPCEGFRSSRSCSHNFNLIIADQRRWGLIRLEDQQLTGGISQSRSVSVTDFCLWRREHTQRFEVTFIRLLKRGGKKQTPHPLVFTQIRKHVCCVSHRNLLDYSPHPSLGFHPGTAPLGLSGVTAELWPLPGLPPALRLPPPAGRRAAQATLQ